MDKYGILNRYFGYSQFRPGQEALIDALLSGRDVFGIMPTGGGKSICYQVPALLLPGITFVVSPLISLMRDQVLALKGAGVSAAYINSTLNAAQLQAVYRNLRAGQYKIVYIAPERLDSDNFAALAATLPISFLAVDEAHCISQWGQDFRPSYLRILQFIDALPRRPVVGAFTATATAQVREDVIRILKLRNPTVVTTGFDRPNLFFQVLRPELKDRELLGLLSARRSKSGIIYCATRKSVETVCEMLQGKGYAATRYHAGLEEAERAKNQEDFLHDRCTIMVATNAFGMGIDKSNVSFVIHYNMPKSMEAYYQEAGRAGRDGTEADCILLYAPRDVQTARFLIDQGNDNEEMDPVTQALLREQNLRRLEAMTGYCKTGTCLRGYILEYFGQKHPEACGNCGTCRGSFEKLDITKESQMILSCVRRIQDKLGYPLGSGMVAKVLQGSREKKLLELGLEDLSTYGLLKTTGRTRIRSYIDHLESEGYLAMELEHQTLQLTPKAAQVLYRGQTVEILVHREELEEDPQVSGKLTSDETDLYDALRRLRGQLAREAGIPAYVVFSNATLQDMARRKPKNMREFRQVSGVGELKANWYGREFLKTILEFCDIVTF